MAKALHKIVHAPPSGEDDDINRASDPQSEKIPNNQDDDIMGTDAYRETEDILREMDQMRPPKGHMDNFRFKQDDEPPLGDSREPDLADLDDNSQSINHRH